MFAIAFPPDPVFGVPGVTSVDVLVVPVCAAAEPASNSKVAAAVVTMVRAVIAIVLANKIGMSPAPVRYLTRSALKHG
jgi:hypothetical protein